MHFSGDSVVKNLLTSAGDVRSIPGLGISLEKKLATHLRILAWEVLSRECMFLGSLSRHNKDLEQRTLKPLVRHSFWVLDKPCYSS